MPLTTIAPKFALQDNLYNFPYHYLPTIATDTIGIHQQLNWGMEYLTYMSFVIEKIRQLQPTTLLDVGCGDGRLVNMIKPYVPKIMGVDLSTRAIQFAMAFNPDIKFLAGDLNEIEEKFDILALVEVLEHIPENAMQTFISSLAARMELNGKVIITVPSVNIPLNKKHYRHYTLELLKSTVEPTFTISDHWWLYHRCRTERFLRALLYNRWFTTNHPGVRNFVWRMHKKQTYMATAQTGAHLVAIAHRTEEKILK